MRSPIATSRLFVFILAMLALALPVSADIVTVSGNVSFSSLDGSSLDDDGVANGTFTNNNGDLIVLGTINCNDDGVGSNSACSMNFVISGNVVLDPGSALYAENRTGAGNGGNIGLTVGGNLIVTGTTSQPGAIISSASLDNTGSGGAITMSVGGTSTFGAGSAVSSASIGGNAGAIQITSAGVATIDGLIAAGPSRTLVAAGRHSGEPLSGGVTASQKGGNITIQATSTNEPGLIVNSNATIVSQGQAPGAGLVRLDGCGTQIRGVIASVARDGATAGVTVRSGTTLTIDGRDLAIAGGTRKGQLRADSARGTAAPYTVRALARTTLSILGASTGGIAVLNSNPGANNAAGGTIDAMSTEGDVAASGNAIRAGDTANGDQGGTINVSAKGNVNLDTAAIRANGGSNGSSKGGAVNVRSYSGAVSWQNGTGDVRPTGSSVAAANRGTITITYCTTVNTTGSTFPVNGSPTGPFPTLVQTCSPAAPTLPLGESLPVCNRPPVVTNDAYSVAEGGTLNVAAPGVLGNDVEPDGQPMTAILVSGPSNAALGGFTFNADGSFTYTHNGSETTTDSFTYKATDGTLESSVATVTITIVPVNDAPVANNDNYGVAEGGTLNVAAPGVKANDTDPDGPLSNAILVTGPANAASFTLNADGSFIYVHNGSETTSDSFTYKINDGVVDSNVATVSIVIDEVNDAPVAVADAYTVAEGGTLNVAAPGVLGNDSDAEGSISAILVSGPANAQTFTLNANGSFQYVHNGSETTSDSFTYKANDGSLDSNTVTVSITVTAVNDAPVANDDAYTVAEGGTLVIPAPGVLGNDTDADNVTLFATVGTNAGNGMLTLNADGSFTYVHNGGESTSDSFTYTASDGTATSNVATVTITITPVNDAPVANPDVYSVNAGSSLTVPAPGVIGNDVDPDNPTLTAILVAGPANASAFSFNADGSFSYTPNSGFAGNDFFTYKVNDGTVDSNTTTVTINVVNQAPVANNDAYTTVGNTELRVSAAGGPTPHVAVAGSVLANDTDPDSPTLTVSAYSATSAAGGQVVMAPNGTFNYFPPTGFIGTDTFTYTVTDGISSANGTVTLTVFSRVWYVNNTAVSGSGRSHQPFSTLSAAQAASAAGDYIYVHFGNGTSSGQNSGIVLKNNQKLVGEGVALVVGAFTLHPAGGTPTIGNSAGTGVTLANGNTVTGLNVAAFGIGISGSSVSGGTIQQVGISGGSDGLSLSGTSGSWILTNVNVAPGGVGLIINGGTPAVTASNLDIVTTGSKGIVATGSGSLATSSGSTVASTNATAVDIDGLSLNVSLQSVSSSNAVNGILLQNTTGSFAVTGTGTAGTGGTLANMSQRAVSAINASGLSLSYMNITNGATANGTAANVCGNTLAGTTTGCNASIHLENVSGASFSNVVVNGSAQVGINGHTVSNLSMSNVEVTNAGNETFEHGVQFVNLSGTSTVSGSNFHDNFYRQFTVQNSAGSLNLSVSSTTFDGTTPAVTGAQGALVSASGTGSLTVNVSGSTFTNNFGAGWFSDIADGATLNATLTGNTFTNNAGAINLASNGSGSMTYSIQNNVAGTNNATAINIFKGALSTNAVTGVILGNTIGTTGVVGSGCPGPCEAMGINSNGSGSLQTRVENNTIRRFGGRAIGVQALQGSSNLQIRIANNTIAEPDINAGNGLLVQSGGLIGDTTSVCADIVGNNITGTYLSTGIRVRNRFATTLFRLPGYAGAGNDVTAVAAFLSGQNGGASASATISGNTFGGGAACTTP